MLGTFLCKTLHHLSLGLRVSSTHKELYFFQRYPSLLSLRYISSTSNPQHSFTVSYLINSCGLSPESALSVSKRVKFETPEQPNSVLELFNNHGFSKTHISKLIKKFPIVLLSNPDKTLLPKFIFFYSKGLSSLELADLLSSNPFILRCSLKNQIMPSFEFFENFLHSHKKIMTTIKRSSRSLSSNLDRYVSPNMAVLRDSGVPEANITFFLAKQPGKFLTTCDKFKGFVEEVKKMGFDPLGLKFVRAIFILQSMSKSTWDRKVEVYKSWGWSREETLQAFVKFPWCMTVSEDKIMAKMDFFVNQMGWESLAIARCPLFISMSLDKRIVPRCSVVQVLLSRGLIKKDCRISKILKPSEKKFLHEFVTCYKDEVPQLLKLYQEKKGL